MCTRIRSNVLICGSSSYRDQILLAKSEYVQGRITLCSLFFFIYKQPRENISGTLQGPHLTIFHCITCKNAEAVLATTPTYNDSTVRRRANNYVVWDMNLDQAKYRGDHVYQSFIAIMGNRSLWMGFARHSKASVFSTCTMSGLTELLSPRPAKTFYT